MCVTLATLIYYYSFMNIFCIFLSNKEYKIRRLVFSNINMLLQYLLIFQNNFQIFSFHFMLNLSYNHFFYICFCHLFIFQLIFSFISISILLILILILLQLVTNATFLIFSCNIYMLFQIYFILMFYLNVQLSDK